MRAAVPIEYRGISRLCGVISTLKIVKFYANGTFSFEDNFPYFQSHNLLFLQNIEISILINDKTVTKPAIISFFLKESRGILIALTETDFYRTRIMYVNV